jgi:acyl carrier protein
VCPRLRPPSGWRTSRTAFPSQAEVPLGTGDSGEVAVRPDLDRSQALSLVSDALGVVIPDLRVEELDERQELHDELGLDSLGVARLLIELEGKLGVQLVDEHLMTIELVTVADLIDLVERVANPAAKET